MSQLRLQYDSLQLLGGKSTLLFLGANEGEGATTAAISTANTLCRSGSANVLLAEVNFAMPKLAGLFGLPDSPGMLELLDGEVEDMDEAIHVGRSMSRPQPFDVVVAGQTMNGGFLSEDRFQQLVQRFRTRYDYVLLDACPLHVGPWLKNVMPSVDGVLLVVSCERTRWEVAQHLTAQLRELGVPVLGVLMNRRKYYVPYFLYRRFRRTGG